jgi:hypothetical protein
MKRRGPRTTDRTRTTDQGYDASAMRDTTAAAERPYQCGPGREPGEAASLPDNTGARQGDTTPRVPWCRPYGLAMGFGGTESPGSRRGLHWFGRCAAVASPLKEGARSAGCGGPRTTDQGYDASAMRDVLRAREIHRVVSVLSACTMRCREVAWLRSSLISHTSPPSLRARDSTDVAEQERKRSREGSSSAPGSARA